MDESSAGAPVSITRTCGHIRCVNSRALELAGITRNTPDPVGGEIERDASGEPTGVLKETARDLVLPFIPKETYEEKVQNLVDLGNRLKSQGIVAVCDMGQSGHRDNFHCIKKRYGMDINRKPLSIICGTILLMIRSLGFQKSAAIKTDRCLWQD